MSGRRWGWPWIVLAVASVFLVSFASLRIGERRASHRTLDKKQAAQVGGIVDKAVGRAVENLQAQPPAGEAVYAAIAPPLVVIDAERAVGAPSGSGDLGAGVIVNQDGAILTALHVVDGATAIKVTFADGTKSAATVASSDPDHDIAVLTADQLPSVVVPAVLGGGAQIGDDAYAVGHPLGLAGSLTAGVISGLDRSFSPGGPGGAGRTFSGLIQFDAAVNPGSSGGPLLNKKGQVIGIVTGLANPAGDGDFVGIGFAVPIATAGGAAGAPAQ